MHSQLTCYIMEATTTFNRLLGRPQIHENCVVLSMLHQCFKYVGEELNVHRQFMDNNSFYGLEEHCADVVLYTPEEKASDDIKSDKGKEILTIVPTEGRTFVKEGTPRGAANPDNAPGEVTGTLQKLH